MMEVASSVSTDFWQDRPVYVTGATGLVGSWLVNYLLAGKADVICLERDWVPHSVFVNSGARSKVRTVSGDIRDSKLQERILAEYRIDTVMHLAAQTIVQTANMSPAETLDVNINGTVALLDACRRTGVVKQVVVASSDKAYGIQKKLPYDENTPLQGQHPYDVSKSCTDLISQTYAHSYGIPIVVTRCGNFYGGGDLNWDRIVPGTIRSIIRGQPPVIRSDGSFIRDYFYVEDGALAYMHLVESLAANPALKGEAFNFSNEIQVTVLELTKKILGLMDSKLEPVILNQAKNEINHQYLDATKARKMLNWKPKFDLDSGLARTITWYRKFLCQ